MNLPNFVNFEPFNTLRKKMGAMQLGEFNPRGKNAPPPRKPPRPAGIRSRESAPDEKSRSTQATSLRDWSPSDTETDGTDKQNGPRD